MRDALNNFGTIALTGGAVTLPDVIDFGQIDERASAQTHRTGEQHDCTAVFAVDADLSATLTAPKLEHSDDNAAFTDLVTAADVPSGTPAGNVAVIPFPLEHKRYVRAAAGGGATGINLSAWFEPGPHH